MLQKQFKNRLKFESFHRQGTHGSVSPSTCSLIRPCQCRKHFTSVELLFQLQINLVHGCVNQCERSNLPFPVKTRFSFLLLSCGEKNEKKNLPSLIELLIHYPSCTKQWITVPFPISGVWRYVGSTKVDSVKRIGSPITAIRLPNTPNG